MVDTLSGMESVHVSETALGKPDFLKPNVGNGPFLSSVSGLFF